MARTGSVQVGPRGGRYTVSASGRKNYLRAWSEGRGAVKAASGGGGGARRTGKSPADRKVIAADRSWRGKKATSPAEAKQKVAAHQGASRVRHDKKMIASKGAATRLANLRARKAESKLGGGALPRTAAVLANEGAKSTLAARAAKNASRPDAPAARKAPPFQSSAAHKEAAAQDRRALDDKTSTLFAKKGIVSAVRKKTMGIDGPLRAAPTPPENTGRGDKAIMALSKGKPKAAMNAAKFASLQKSLGAAPAPKYKGSPADKLAALRADKAKGKGGAAGLMAPVARAQRAAKAQPQDRRARDRAAVHATIAVAKKPLNLPKSKGSDFTMI